MAKFHLSLENQLPAAGRLKFVIRIIFLAGIVAAVSSYGAQTGFNPGGGGVFVT